MKNLNELTFKPSRPGAMKKFIEFIQEDMGRLEMTDRAIGLELLPHYKKITDGERVIFQCRKELIENGFIESRKFNLDKHINPKTREMIKLNGIYGAIDKETKEMLYIGYTSTSFADRWGNHLVSCHREDLRNAIAEESIEFVVLYPNENNISTEALMNLESYYIYTLQPKFNKQKKSKNYFVIDADLLKGVNLNTDFAIDLNLVGGK